MIKLVRDAVSGFGCKGVTGMNISKKVGARIKIIRKAHGVTQVQLGEAINVEKSRIWRIEKGISRVLVDELYAVAQYFDVDCHIFLDDEFTITVSTE